MSVRTLACVISGVVALVLVVSVVGAGPEAGASPLSTSIGHSQARAERITAAAMRTAPSAQREALADGRVTAVEYRRAVDATRSCIAADARAVLKQANVHLAIDVSAPVLSDDGFRYTYDWGITSTGSEPKVEGIAPEVRDALLAASRRCEHRLRDATEQVHLAHKQADAVYVERQVAGFSRCLEEREVLAEGTSSRPAKLDNLYGSITAQRAFASTAEAGSLRAHADEAYSCLARYPSLAEQPGV